MIINAEEEKAHAYGEAYTKAVSEYQNYINTHKRALIQKRLILTEIQVMRKPLNWRILSMMHLLRQNWKMP